MSAPTPPSFPWRPIAVATAAGVAAVALVMALAGGAALRSEATRAAAEATAELDRLAPALAAADSPAQSEAILDQARVPVRTIGPAGRTKLAGRESVVWQAGPAPYPARFAVWGSGAVVGDAVVEVVRPGPGDTRLVARQPVAMGTAGVLHGGWVALVAVAIGGAGAGAGAWWLTAHARSRRERIRRTVDTIAAGRPPRTVRIGDPQLDAALEALGRRAEEWQGAAHARMEALGAALGPLPLAVAARTPSGGLIRNDALEGLVADLVADDARQIEDAVRWGLAERGVLSRLVVLGDGRALAVEAWAVPGGRLVALAERGEQERLAQMRRRLSGAAVQSMAAPVAQIRRGAEALADHVPVSAAPHLAAVSGSAERLERVVQRLLRADLAERRGSSAPPEPVSVAAIAFGLGQAHDRRLRALGLRLEHDLPTEPLAVVADAGLVHEILSELVDNAARSASRGETITLTARPVSPGRVVVEVRDTGPGVPGAERALIMEPFGRGGAAAARPGLGLGLGVARELAERIGGRLRAAPGPGGRFTLELPRSVAAAGGRSEGHPAPVRESVAVP